MTGHNPMPDLDRHPAYRLTLGVSVARVAELVGEGRLTRRRGRRPTS